MKDLFRIIFKATQSGRILHFDMSIICELSIDWNCNLKKNVAHLPFKREIRTTFTSIINLNCGYALQPYIKKIVSIIGSDYKLYGTLSACNVLYCHIKYKPLRPYMDTSLINYVFHQLQTCMILTIFCIT